MNTVVIGCKLPHGFTFKTPDGRSITLNGMNRAVIAGTHGITKVDADDAAVFFATHADFAPVKANAIFYNSSDKLEDLDAMSLELKAEKTGFEGMDPAKPAPGLEAVPGQALDDSKLQQRSKAVARASRAKATK
jgi:hypothetical protein